MIPVPVPTNWTWTAGWQTVPLQRMAQSLLHRLLFLLAPLCPLKDGANHLACRFLSIPLCHQSQLCLFLCQPFLQPFPFINTATLFFALSALFTRRFASATILSSALGFGEAGRAGCRTTGRGGPLSRLSSATAAAAAGADGDTKIFKVWTTPSPVT